MHGDFNLKPSHEKTDHSLPKWLDHFLLTACLHRPPNLGSAGGHAGPRRALHSSENHFRAIDNLRLVRRQFSLRRAAVVAADDHRRDADGASSFSDRRDFSPHPTEDGSRPVEDIERERGRRWGDTRPLSLARSICPKLSPSVVPPRCFLLTVIKVCDDKRCAREQLRRGAERAAHGHGVTWAPFSSLRRQTHT